MIAPNSKSLVFYGIAEIFIDPVGLERNWESWDYVFLVKSFCWLRKIVSYRFQYSAKDHNSEFSLPSMVPCVKVKLQVIVLGYRKKMDSLELEIVTSKQFHVSLMSLEGPLSPFSRHIICPFVMCFVTAELVVLLS